jgi:hypothetical protein
MSGGFRKQGTIGRTMSLLQLLGEEEIPETHLQEYFDDL